MASAISADESFEQAITMVLRGDENTDNGLYSRVNLFVSHRHPRQRCRALKVINCVRFQTAQARLANASDDLSDTERARWLKRPIASYGKSRLLAAGPLNALRTAISAVGQCHRKKINGLAL
jgi:hypothetical protein